MKEDLSEDRGSFFTAVRPSSRIVDSYSFNGNLETIFNMTQESDNTWLFRKPFDVTSKRIVCRSEKSAINDFMNFIEKLQSPVKLIGVDEETVSCPQ